MMPWPLRTKGGDKTLESRLGCVQGAEQEERIREGGRGGTGPRRRRPNPDRRERGRRFAEKDARAPRPAPGHGRAGQRSRGSRAGRPRGASSEQNPTSEEEEEEEEAEKELVSKRESRTPGALPDEEEGPSDLGAASRASARPKRSRRRNGARAVQCVRRSRPREAAPGASGAAQSGSERHEGIHEEPRHGKLQRRRREEKD
ncbi:unnamed protein product [Prorocentrum cordatum]|uniref:Uncharacterized protein n=1 Tax=Prorocentrum cordatum TaxID=2364126 RepID=A0ABN9TGR9_9DINO|nr:unnamed protein product [Polarella glacialis]